MGWGNNNPPPRNPNANCPDPNKHCDDVVGANIDDWIWQISGIIVALIIAHFIFNPKKRVMISEFLSSVLALGVLVVMLVMFKKRKV